jgi:tRNA(Ile2) C34 agmatinyltransferase TiaS
MLMRIWVSNTSEASSLLFSGLNQVKNQLRTKMKQVNSKNSSGTCKNTNPIGAVMKYPIGRRQKNLGINQAYMI